MKKSNLNKNQQTNFDFKKSKTKAFTLAEVLITLTVIGIVAAITIPSLLANINERVWNAQRKGLHARLAQALAMMPRLDGYGTYETDDDDNVTDTAAETFLADGLSKVYQITNICADVNDTNTADYLTACGLPSTITTLDGNVEISSFPISIKELGGDSNKLLYTTGSSLGDFESTINTKAVGFQTGNGESIALFYNPYCGSDNLDSNHFIQNKICANFVYDLNGTKGPNQIGKDMGFVTALYRSDPVVVAPLPYTSNASGTYTFDNAPAACQAIDSDLRMPSRDELGAMFYNYYLINITSGSFWSGSVVSAGASGLGWEQNFHLGSRYRYSRTNTGSVRCVRR